MSFELSKSKRVLFLFAVMLSNIVVMGDTIIYPIVYNLYEAFPTQVSAVNYILSGPPLLLVLASLIAPLILRKISKKTLLVIGGTLFTIGAVFGIAIESAMWMVFTRSLVGIGQGFVNVAAIALIAEVFVEENIYAKYVGFYNASMNVVGMVFAYFAGTFALNQWQDSFMLYYSSIPMLILIILFVPNIKSEEVVEENKVTGKDEKKEPMGFEFWQMIITFFIYNICAMIIGYFMSVYVAENALGDPTLTGTAFTTSQFLSIFLAIAFGTLYSKMKQWTLTLGYFIGILAFVSMYFFPSAVTPYIGLCFNSAGYIFAFSYAYARGAVIVPESRINSAVAIVTATYGIGTFVSTYFVTWIMGLFNTTMITPILIVPIILTITLTVFETVYILTTKKEQIVKNSN